MQKKGAKSKHRKEISATRVSKSERCEVAADSTSVQVQRREATGGERRSLGIRSFAVVGILLCLLISPFLLFLAIGKLPDLEGNLLFVRCSFFSDEWFLGA